MREPTKYIVRQVKGGRRHLLELSELQKRVRSGWAAHAYALCGRDINLVRLEPTDREADCKGCLNQWDWLMTMPVIVRGEDT